MITYINPNLSYEQLRQEMRGICRFPSDQVFTMKWVDEEGIRYMFFLRAVRITLFKVRFLNAHIFRQVIRVLSLRRMS